jgi:hypothetical protein
MKAREESAVSGRSNGAVFAVPVDKAMSAMLNRKMATKKSFFDRNASDTPLSANASASAKRRS